MSTIIISCQILSCFFGTLSVCMYVFEKMSAGKKQRSSRFTQGMTDALVEAYGKHQVSEVEP